MKDIYKISASNISDINAAIINDMNRFQSEILFYAYDNSCPIQISKPIGDKWIKFIGFSRVDTYPIFDLSTCSKMITINNDYDYYIAGIKLNDVKVEKINTDFGFTITPDNVSLVAAIGIGHPAIADNITSFKEDIKFNEGTGEITIDGNLSTAYQTMYMDVDHITINTKSNVTSYTIEKSFNELLNMTKDKCIKGSNELSKLDYLFKSIFHMSKTITYINSPTFYLDKNNNIVKESKDEFNETNKLYTIGIYNLFLDDLTSLNMKNTYIYSIESKNDPVTNIPRLVIRMCESIANVKKKVTFTISDEIYSEFSILADKLAINKSKFIENKVVEFISKNK